MENLSSGRSASDMFLFPLVQHDAATRVIARLKKERDEARALLAEVESRPAAAPAEVAPHVANGKRGERTTPFSSAA